MKVLICGGRWIDAYAGFLALETFFSNKDWIVEEIIHGGALGGDTSAHFYAKRMNIPVNVFKADWEKYGRFAGPIRNKLMLTQGNPDVIVALPGGSGTEHMKKIGREAGIQVIELELPYVLIDDGVLK